MFRQLLCGPLVGLVLIATDLSAQATCPAGRISEIVIESHSIFAPDELPDGGRLAWAYRAANSIHIATRPELIASEIVLREGACFDPAELRESARILRQFRFISRAEVVADEQGSEGDRRILVTTRDEWTTKAAVNLRVEGGIRFEGASIFEENLLGRGVALGAFLIDRDAHREVGAALEVPSIGGSALDGSLRVGRTRAGDVLQQALIRPFNGERPGTALRQEVDIRRDLFSYSSGERSGITHLLTPISVRRLELSIARRVGPRGRLRILGGGVTFERLAVGGGDRVEGVRRGDFSVREGVDPELGARIASQAGFRRALRLNLLLGVRQLRFETRDGLDAVRGVQDVPVGREVLLVVGRSVWGGSGERGDLYARGGLLLGGTGLGLASKLHLTLEGRREDGGDGGAGEWRDLLMEARGIIYLGGAAPSGSPTWVLRGAFQSGWRTTSPFQLTLGGPDGVRGYSEEDLPGGRRAVLSIESRIPWSGPFPELIDMGFTLFGDVGSMWDGDAPFGVDSGWRAAVGAGVRIGFPAGTSSVIRADVAFPVGRGASDGGPILRISATEWLGITGRLVSPQMQRSRTSGVRADYVGVARESGVW